MRIDLTELRQRFSIALKGADVAQLMRHAQALNPATRPLRLELDEINELRLPCMLHWNLSDLVVLVTVGRNKVSVLDLVSDKRELGFSEVSTHFTHVVAAMQALTHGGDPV